MGRANWTGKQQKEVSGSFDVYLLIIMLSRIMLNAASADKLSFLCRIASPKGCVKKGKLKTNSRRQQRVGLKKRVSCRVYERPWLGLRFCVEINVIPGPSLPYTAQIEPRLLPLSSAAQTHRRLTPARARTISFTAARSSRNVTLPGKTGYYITKAAAELIMLRKEGKRG